MKIVLGCLFFLLLAPVLKAQVVIYDENVQLRQVEAFNAIEVSGTISLYLSQGQETAVAISAGEEKYNQYIKTEVNNGVLQIKVDGGFWNSFGLTNKKLKAYVSVPDINRLDVSGASYASIDGILKVKELQMNISGASEAKGNIQAEKLNLSVSGASVVRLAGVVREGVIAASGACKINSYDLSFDKLKATSSGASNIRVTVNAEIIGDASGGANIYYKGAPATTRLNASAGASIKNRSSDKD